MIQKLSPNFNKGRGGNQVTDIVIHWVGAGTAESAANWFSKESSGVSAHYIVGNEEIYQCVLEEDTAWHAGNFSVNQRSIGIEHEATPDLPPSEEVYKKSAALIADISKRHGIKIDSEHIYGHNKVKATRCPGSIDIGRLIDMAKGEMMTLKETVIDWDDAEGKRHEVGWYVREWWGEKKNGIKQAEEIAKKNRDYERLQETNADQTITITGLRKDTTDLKAEKVVLESKIEALEAKLSSDVGELNQLLDVQKNLTKVAVDRANKLDAQVTKLKAKVKATLREASFWEWLKSKFGGDSNA